ncbi:MAG TPA: DUF4136 domain-containing protein [Candidatus Eisenbacteria bacterium]|nr:DUF4136 domain-containing protein [Candidatus Eisenbacteria bacterium]
MTRLPSVLVAALALALAACSQFTIRTGYDKSADFSHLHTYAWLPIDQAAPADQNVPDRLIDTQIRAAADDELTAKGYRSANGGPADFLLNYRLTTRAGEDLSADASPYGWGWWGWPGAEVTTYSEGTLYLGVIDPKAKRMIWLGAAEARIMPQMSISYEKRRERIFDAVDQILAKFPPQ